MTTYPHTQDMTLAELNAALDKLKRDHDEIRASVGTIRQISQEIIRSAAPVERTIFLRLYALTEELNGALERHGQWEDEKLFPLVTEMFPMKSHPYLMTSLWMLEKEHRLADDYFRTYFQEMRDLPIQPEGATLQRPLDILLHACRLVAQHLESEEDILIPLYEH